MLAKVWTAAVAAVFAGALMLPVPAAYAQSAPAAKPMAMKKPMAKKSAHKMDCYDYAWQSAAMADCLAKKGNKASKASTMKPMKKSKKKAMAS